MFLEGFQSLSTNFRNYNIHILMAISDNYSIDIIIISAVNGEGYGGGRVMT